MVRGTWIEQSWSVGQKPCLEDARSTFQIGDLSVFGVTFSIGFRCFGVRFFFCYFGRKNVTVITLTGLRFWITGITNSPKVLCRSFFFSFTFRELFPTFFFIFEKMKVVLVFFFFFFFFFFFLDKKIFFKI